MSSIRFIGVGRDKKSWTANVNYPSDEQIIAAMRISRIAMPASVSITYDVQADRGTIWAGPNKVGEFVIQNEAVPK